MTIPTQPVLRALLADPAQERYGVEIGTAAGLASGTVHPILARLEGVGWLTSRWKEIDPRAEGRPARRYYRLTPDGLEPARSASTVGSSRGTTRGSGTGSGSAAAPSVTPRRRYQAADSVATRSPSCRCERAELCADALA